jgi:hypothetical protein
MKHQPISSRVHDATPHMQTPPHLMACKPHTSQRSIPLITFKICIAQLFDIVQTRNQYVCVNNYEPFWLSICTKNRVNTAVYCLYPPATWINAAIPLNLTADFLNLKADSNLPHSMKFPQQYKTRQQFLRSQCHVLQA